MVVAPEKIDFVLWPKEIQQEGYDELVVLLGITPSSDYPSMTDEELTASLAALIVEIKTRPGVSIIACESILFGTSNIISEIL